MSVLKYPPCGRTAVRPFPNVAILLVAILLVSAGSFCRHAAGQAGPAADPGTPAAAQSWREMPVDENVWTPTKIGQTRSLVGGMLRRGTFAGNEQAVFDDYYKSYRLARWTLVDNRAKLASYRTKELRRDFINGKGAVYSHLNALVLEFMGGLAKPDPPTPNYHPATRINAILAIGELDLTKPAKFADLPVPLPAALPALLEIVQDADQPDAVKVAALVGLIRHARFGRIAAPVDRAAILELAKSASPAGAAGAGKAWMRAQAAEILGELKVADAATTAALAVMVGDSTLGCSARCAAAEALGKLDYAGAAGLNPSALAAPLGKLAVDACTTEEQAQIASRRRLMRCLKAAMEGLAAVAAPAKAAGPAHDAFVGALQAQVKVMLEQIGDAKGVDDATLKSDVNQGAGKLRAALAKKPGA